jgi:hypothetical protein
MRLSWLCDDTEIAQFFSHPTLGLLARHGHAEKTRRISDLAHSERLPERERHSFLARVRREPSELAMRAFRERHPALDVHLLQMMQEMLRFVGEITPAVQDKATVHVRIYCVLHIATRGFSAHSKLKTTVARSRNGIDLII